tara:strand:+ start:10940 stop:11059 length:120 start_codon:yes stop_codon:yes gene_type:complete
MRIVHWPGAGRMLDIAPDRVLKGPMIATARIIGLSIGKD